MQIIATVNTAIHKGIEMKYVKFGNGNKTMVIIPGVSIRHLTDTAKSIANAYKSFAKEYTVYLFDRNENLNDGCSVKDMAEDMAEILISLGLKNIYLYGTSQGGMISLIMASMYPELFKKIAVCSTAIVIPEKSAEILNSWSKIVQENKMELLAQKVISTIMSEDMYNRFKSAFLPAFTEASQEDKRRFAIQSEAAGNFCCNELTNMKAPLLAIAGKGDQIFPYSCTQYIEKITGCKAIYYGEEYGHSVYDDAPDIKGKILDFFEE